MISLLVMYPNHAGFDREWMRDETLSAGIASSLSMFHQYSSPPWFQPTLSIVKKLPPFLLPGVAAAAAVLVWAGPAAADIQSWRFNANQNQLEFTTAEDVQPRAQLIANPTRLVIDLPGVRLERSAYTEPLVNAGAFRAVRFGQFDPDTARVVVELAPGYTINPDRIQFRGITGRRWSVQLPTPERLPANLADGGASEAIDEIVPTAPLPGGPSTGGPPAIFRPPTASPPVAPPRPNPRPTVNPPGPLTGNPTGNPGGTPNPRDVRTQIEGIRVTGDGIFLRSRGELPSIRAGRSGDRRQITFDIPGAAIDPNAPRDQLINRYGVSRLFLTQAQLSPPVVRVTLNVAPTSPDWQATASSLGGIVIVPAGGISAASLEGRPGTAPTGQLAIVDSVALDGSDAQLVIRANQPLSYTTGWDRATGLFKITLNGAQFARQVQQPRLTGSSPVQKLQLRREDSTTVAILFQPGAGVRIGEPSLYGQNILAFQLQRSRPVRPLPVPRPPIGTGPRPTGPITLPRVPNGRIVVVVDPGHGGPDPGAVGRGGIYEKEIVLDIGIQVASLLNQQGVQAVLTRQADVDLDLQPRVDLAEQVNATVFVSIHANAIDMSRPDVNGLETYYYDSGLELAQSIHASVLEATGIPDRRVRSARFFVLRRTSMPSVLVETGFVTGADDAVRLADPSYRRTMAAAIARGILQYLRQ
jgi:N-acetylmuramoyl-L-alanine amidase